MSRRISELARFSLATAIAAGLLAVGAGARQAIAAPSPGPAPSASPAASGPAISWTWTRIVARPGAPRGYVEFQRDCSVCHGSGPAKPGTRALRAKYQGKLPARLEERADLAADYVKYIVRHGVSVMPPFRKTELSDTDLDAIASYLTRRHPPG